MDSHLSIDQLSDQALVEVDLNVLQQVSLSSGRGTSIWSPRGVTLKKYAITTFHQIIHSFSALATLEPFVNNSHQAKQMSITDS
jgi:hypothetical protein